VTDVKKSREIIPKWALLFLRAEQKNVRDLSISQRAKVKNFAMHVVSDPVLVRDEPLRLGSVRLIVDLLPGTFPWVEQQLSDFASPLWHENHFTIFNTWDRADLSLKDQKRVLRLVEDYLMKVKSQAGFAAWKAGDMLGDEWFAPETVEILERLIFSARYVAGRLGAIHGMQHALNTVPPSEEKRLLALMRKVAKEDRSAEVRDYANYTVESGGCYTRRRERKQREIKKRASRR
jgi:hypothetical protein